MIGFTKDEVSDTFKLVAAVIHLGNVELKKISLENGTEGCKVVSKTGTVRVCVKPEHLLVCPVTVSLISSDMMIMLYLETKTVSYVILLDCTGLVYL